MRGAYPVVGVHPSSAGLPPGKIGRYEIVGRLAAGGMGEVLLGRLRGPHGFERAVVIKRILPHLALDKSVVELFLDEARIISNLRHPNLIHVHELGSDGGELYLVMEFLEGETVAGLCRRLAARAELVDFDIAAFIVAEACAGLHAAHEATTPEGVPLHVVHRDVSPQNVFLTYAGGVKVIDFGIATAKNRVTRTETGTLRGKLGYVAPEQIHALPLDRRADVFSLGVVLLELVSGRRIYKRDSDAATLMAILNDTPPALRKLRPEAPIELEQICIRALAKDRTDRYQTAAELRRVLLAFAHRRTDEDLSERLAGLMRLGFAERIEEKTALLRRVEQGADVETMPATEADIDVQIPQADVPTASAVRPNAAATLRRDGATGRLLEGKRALVAGASLVVVALASAGIGSRLGRPANAGGAVPPPSATLVSPEGGSAAAALLASPLPAVAVTVAPKPLDTSAPSTAPAQDPPKPMTRPTPHNRPVVPRSASTPASATPTLW